MSFCCDCSVLSGRVLCDGQIIRPEESNRLWCVVVCDLETSRMTRPWPALGHSAAKDIYIYIYIYTHTHTHTHTIFVNNQLDEQFFFMHVYFYSPHVSDSYMCPSTGELIVSIHLVYVNLCRNKHTGKRIVRQIGYLQRL